MANAVALPERHKPSVTENIVGIIRAPQLTFSSLKSSSDRPVMLGLICLCSMAAAAVFLYRFAWHDYPAQARHTISLITYVSSVLSPVLSLLALAGIYLATFRFTMKSDIDYLTCLDVVICAWVPAMIKSLVAIGMLLFTHPVIFGTDRIVPSNLATLLHPNPSSAMSPILSSIDLFSLWTLCLIVIGFSVVIPGTTRLRVAIRVALLWILLVLARGSAMFAVEWLRAAQHV